MRYDNSGSPTPNDPLHEPPTEREEERYLCYEIDAEGNKSDAFLLDDIPEVSPVGRDIIRKKLERLGLAPEKIDIFMRNVK